MSLLDDLAALKAPGANHGTTLPGTVRPETAPKGWEPGYRVEPGGAMLVTTTAQTANVQHDEHAWHRMVEDLGLTIPEGWRVRLVEAKYDPAAWTRDTPDQDKAVTRPVWRYRFAVEPDTRALLAGDLETLIRDAMRTRRKRPKETEDTERALIVVYADAQLGKVGSGGDSRALAARIADRFDRMEDHIRDLRKIGRGPTSAYWMDAGDGLENFDNVTNQAFTNDLTLTEQVRAYRRVVFEGLNRLARLFPDVTAAVCGSNHGQVRRGKDPVGPPINDWGIEVLSQVQDAFAANPDAYGHVKFAYPAEWRSSLALDVAGTRVGLAHGHHASNPNKVPEWWAKQAFGGEPVGDARILITGHWHHLRAQQLADGRLWVQAPTLDNASDWWAELSGDQSVPGMLVLSVTKDGWDDLRLL